MLLKNSVRVLISLVLFVKVNGEVTGIGGNATDDEYDLLPKLFHLDDFDRCMAFRERALYCSITAELTPSDSQQSKIWTIIQKVNSSKKNYRHDWLRHGICVSESCPKLSENILLYKSDNQLLQTALSECYTNKYKDLGLKATVTKLHCETNQPEYPVDIYDMLVAMFLLLLIATVIFASFYDRLATCEAKDENGKTKTNTFGEMISCFSIPRNWKRLGSSNNNPDTEPLKCFDGLRFYITVLMIITHSCFGTAASSIWNPRYLEKITEDPQNTLILNGLFIIQIFLIMAGWLLSYHFLVLFEKHKEIQFKYMIRAFMYRYIRLTPTSLVMIAISGTWLYHTSRGPIWDKVVGDEYRNCRTNWWTNLLYINNYYDVEHMCMPTTWYLATDTQLFGLSLLIIMLMWKYQNHIKLILGVCFGMGTIIPGIINYVYNYDILLRPSPESLYKLHVDVPEFNVMYIAGYTNIGGYTTGLFCGYIYYKTRGQKFMTKMRDEVLCFILVWTLTLSSVMVALPMYKDDFEYTRLEAALYVALARNVYCIGAGLALFGWSQGKGGFQYRALVNTPIRILGRLTYCVYLVHYTLIRIHTGQARSPFFFTPYLCLMQAFGDIVMSYMCGLILCLFVELPTTAILKLLVPLTNKHVKEVIVNKTKTTKLKSTRSTSKNRVSKK